MEITLTRDNAGRNCQFGILTAGGFSWETLEDTVREIEGEPVESWKINGETAIPRGRYKVVWNWSNHFQRFLPQLLDVPGFDGIRIHSGNFSKDTEGCILLGNTRGDDCVLDSRAACAAFNRHLVEWLNEDDVWITVM